MEKMKLILRNVKCVFSIQDSLEQIIKEFQFHKKNHTFRLQDKICLTIYPKNLFRIHATGIKTVSDLNSVLLFFDSNCMRISKIQVNNTFWILKLLLIQNFDKFAKFCQNTQIASKQIYFDLSNLGLNGDGGFLNAIYLRHIDCRGAVIIHRTCSLIMGPKHITEIILLKNELKILLKSFKASMQKKILENLL